MTLDDALKQFEAVEADRLPDIRARTLLLWSDSDEVSPPPVAHLLASRIPRSGVVTVAGLTHAFASERPEETAAIIRSHLAGTEPTR